MKYYIVVYSCLYPWPSADVVTFQEDGASTRLTTNRDLAEKIKKQQEVDFPKWKFEIVEFDLGASNA